MRDSAARGRIVDATRSGRKSPPAPLAKMQAKAIDTFSLKGEGDHPVAGTRTANGPQRPTASRPTSHHERPPAAAGEGGDGQGGAAPPQPTGITGFTAHGRDSVESHDGHGVNNNALSDAVAHPTEPPSYELDTQGRPSYIYVGEDSTVILNLDGEVVTAWANNHNGWRYP